VGRAGRDPPPNSAQEPANGKSEFAQQRSRQEHSTRVVRTPLFLEPDWPAQLIKEAHDIQFHKPWRSGSTYLEDWIKRYRFLVAKAESEHPGLDDEALALQWGDDLARCILEWMFIPDRLFEVENNPYERTEGFWTMLASILPAWRDWSARY
jgi:hypothetical protein